MATDKRALQPGTVIHNRYRVEKVLGAGGFGVTYQVTDTKENCIAAMKEYMPMDIAYRPMGSKEVRPLTADKKDFYEKFRKQFLDEAQTIYGFDGHPNIIQVRHLFYENNTAYYVMEYVTGMDLGKYLKKNGGSISWKELKPILYQVISALKRVHEKGKIHCDISPDNIFLLDNGVVKLLDFGAAKSTLRGEVETSVIVAKPAYAPYEQMKGTNMGPWTDVYALGVSIYSCVTGMLPPKSEERIMNDHTVWPSAMGFQVPSPHWEPALKRAMALKREDRYQSVVEFWNGLTYGDMTSPVTPTNPVYPPHPPQPPYPPYPPQPSYPKTVQENTNGGATGYPGQFVKPQSYGPMLECLHGVMTGRRIPVKCEMTLGVHPQCNVVMPAGTPGVSRFHLKIFPANGRICVVDLNSTYGTWLNNQKMTPGLVYTMTPGSEIFMGRGEIFRAY